MRFSIPALALLCIALAALPVAAQDTLPNDVTVSFTLCLEGAGGSTGDVCITGSVAAITNWGSGVALTNVEGDLWQADVVFPAGTAATVQYKYRRNGCVDWENDPNRSVTLPTDGSTTFTVAPESFNRVSPIGCGLATALSEDKTICFQVCMGTAPDDGSNCVIGNIPELGAWGTGLPLEPVGSGIYQTCLTWPAGTLAPIDMQYKFQRAGCTEWETLGDDPFANREFQLSNATDAVVTVFSVFANEEGTTCQVVDDDESSFGTIKARFGN